MSAFLARADAHVGQVIRGPCPARAATQPGKGHAVEDIGVQPHPEAR